MIRALYLIPVIAIISILVVCYMFFLRPVLKNRSGKDISTSSAFHDIQDRMKKLKEHQAVVRLTLDLQKNEFLLEGDNILQLYQLAIRKKILELKLAKIGSSMETFHQRILELSGKDDAIQGYHQEIQHGIDALSGDMKSFNIADLFASKEDVALKINNLNEKLSDITKLEDSMTTETNKYVEKSKTTVRQIKSIISENTADISEDYTENVREQNLIHSQTARVIMEQRLQMIREKMADVRDKIESNKEKMRDARSKMIDNRERAQAVRIRAQEMNQRIKDQTRK